MYKELTSFVSHVARQRHLWRDGEFWTALLLAAVAAIWFYVDPAVIGRIREHFADILTVASIIFGFVLTALTFYIDASRAWARDQKIQNVTQKLIDWHVWSILSILALLGYVIVLWAISSMIECHLVAVIMYAILVFLAFYSGFQIVNHTLTIWWVYRSRDQLEGRDSPECQGSTLKQVPRDP